MRRPKLFCVLTLVIAALEISDIYAQTNIRARAVASYRRGTMFRIQKMSDPVEVSGCDRFVLVGTVESVGYDDRSEIVNFSLKARNGKSRRVNLPKTLYQQLPVEAEMALPKLLSRGRRLRAVAYGCVASADALEADEIKAL
jgi:hypothetical protein